MNTYNIVISTNDRTEFITQVLEWGAKGAKVEEGAIPRLKRIPYGVKLVIESKDRMKTGSFPTHLVIEKRIIYTKKELEEFPITELQDLAKPYGVTDREKNKLITKLLDAQEAYLIEKGYKEMVVANKPQQAKPKPVVAPKEAKVAPKEAKVEDKE